MEELNTEIRKVYNINIHKSLKTSYHYSYIVVNNLVDVSEVQIIFNSERKKFF